jgi:cytochrome P450
MTNATDPKIDRALLPPGPRAPAWVNTARLASRPIESLLGWHDRYGDLVTVPLLIFGTGVYVADPEAIREMFTGDQSGLHAGEANAPLAAALGERSVLVLDGAEHLRHRRLLLPPFQGAAVSGYREVIREVAEREVDRWQVGDEFAMRDRMRAATFEVIARVVFGVHDPARIKRLHAALTAVLDATPLLMLPSVLRRDLGPLSPWGRLQRRLQHADALVYEEIALRRVAAAGQEQHDDVLSLLLAARDEDDQPLSDVELRDELMTMLLAGHETTATGLAFAFDLLLHNPAELARLRDELADDSDSYLDAVVTESLRLRPVIDAAERTLVHPRSIAGHELPAGIRVYPNITAVHRRPGPLPRPGRLSTRTVRRGPRAVLRVAAVRRRHPPLHRRRPRAGGDRRDPAGRALARHAARPTPGSRSGRHARHHPRSAARHPGRGAPPRELRRVWSP